MTYIRIPFAEAGDKTAVPFDDPLDGSVNYTEGYGVQYAQDPTTVVTARRIEREKFNQVLNTATAEIRRIQQQGVPDWIPASENDSIDFPYSENAIVRYTDGKVYRSLADNNTALPTDNNFWTDVSQTGGTYLTVTSNLTIQDNDNIANIGVDPGAAPVIVTLPLSTNNINRRITIMFTAPGDNPLINVAIAAPSGDSLDGVTDPLMPLFTVGSYISVIGTPFGWRIVSSDLSRRWNNFDPGFVNITGTTPDVTKCRGRFIGINRLEVDFDVSFTSGTGASSSTFEIDFNGFIGGNPTYNFATILIRGQTIWMESGSGGTYTIVPTMPINITPGHLRFTRAGDVVGDYLSGNDFGSGGNDIRRIYGSYTFDLLWF